MVNEDFENDDTNTTDAVNTGALTLDELNALGLHPDLAALEEEFAATINGLAWPMRKALDEMFGRAMLRGLEIGELAGRFGVDLAMRF